MKNISWVFYLLLLCFIACNFAEKEKYLIPNDFQGNILLVSGVDSGSSVKYLDKVRIYEVPLSGILTTQFVKDYGIIDKIFYYRKGIKEFEISSAYFKDSKSNLDTAKVYAFYGNGYNIEYKDPMKKIGVEIITICKPKAYEEFINEKFIKKILGGNMSYEDFSYTRLLVQKDSLNHKE